TAARPLVSKEMEGDPTPCDLWSPVPSPISRRGEKQNAKEERAHRAVPLQEQILAELSGMLGEGDVVARARELVAENARLIAEREALVAENTLLLDAAITAAVERAVRVPTAVALVEELVRSKKPQTQGEIRAAVEAVVESE